MTTTKTATKRTKKTSSYGIAYPTYPVEVRTAIRIKNRNKIRILPKLDAKDFDRNHEPHHRKSQEENDDEIWNEEGW